MKELKLNHFKKLLNKCRKKNKNKKLLFHKILKKITKLKMKMINKMKNNSSN
jgi:hypothetical protein